MKITKREWRGEDQYVCSDCGLDSFNEAVVKAHDCPGPAKLPAPEKATKKKG
jgi:hypothetical protein